MFHWKAVNGSCCNNDKSSCPFTTFSVQTCTDMFKLFELCVHYKQLIYFNDIRSSREGEWRVLITSTNKLRSGKDNLPLYVQVENLLQLYYQNMFCREREVSKHWHLVKHFSNRCQGLLFHYSLRWSQKRWGQTTASWKSLTGLLKHKGIKTWSQLCFLKPLFHYRIENLLYYT